MRSIEGLRTFLHKRRRYLDLGDQLLPDAVTVDPVRRSICLINGEESVRREIVTVSARAALQTRLSQNDL